MKRGWGKLSLIISIIIIFTIFSSSNVSAGNGKAAIGVKSPPPQFSYIRLEQHDNTIRAYLTICDINGWEDIYSIRIVLEDSGIEKAEFLFRQYEDTEFKDASDWVTTDDFSETSEDNNLLIKEKCSNDHSDIEETLKGCYLNLLFVFQTTWFTRLNIIASDNGGATSNLKIDYTSEDIMRSGTIIIIPGINEPMAIELPPYLLDMIAIIIAAIGTWYIVKKTDVGKIMRAIYEKN